MRISVIICSYNPRPAYLNRVLDALRAQTLFLSLWELLLVDNRSAQPLSAQFDLSWHPHARHLREDALGLTRARLCGIAAAQGQLIVFVDDDNVLSPDYLAICDQIANGFPFLGAWGGQATPELEIPPEFAKHYLDHLAIRSFDKVSWANIPFCSAAAPYGAGMCVRAEVANAYFAATTSSELALGLDRVGSRLISAGDYDLAFTACDLGLGTGLFPALNLIHLIPKERLQKKYLLRLLEAQVYSYTLLRYRRGYVDPIPPRGLVQQSAWLARWLLHQLRGTRFDFQAQAARERGMLQALAEIKRLQQDARESCASVYDSAKVTDNTSEEMRLK